MTGAYVIFEDSRSIWTRLFKKNYRHVSILLPAGEGLWVHIDPVMQGVYYEVVTDEDVEHIHDRVLFHDVSIVQVELKTLYGNHFPAAFTCVELVKRILGIYNWGIVTPYQLYKYLCNQPYPKGGSHER